jgi:DNA polymerase/3'-5' exonuclease PolX
VHRWLFAVLGWEGERAWWGWPYKSAGQQWSFDARLAGSKQFEKDLRFYAASEHNVNLSQQAMYNKDTGALLRNPRSPDGLFHNEEDIFAYLGLKYLPPILRCA